MPFDSTTTKPEVDFPGDTPPADLLIEDITEGDGAEVAAGDTIEAHYVGVAWSTGEEFDSSWNRGEPLRFQIGVGQVITGWDEGIVGMLAGGRRKLTIPPHMGYGANGAGSAIGPNETLIFVVDLVSSNRPGAGAAFGIG
ncbi:MAG: FKBP-type peptidyl-prolyl cis-trans isomerase [Allobranchiibius sp.]|nr:FKBP-type peptidyl-prolyl cis-trans isomerase [Actinomycetota bacterium]